MLKISAISILIGTLLLCAGCPEHIDQMDPADTDDDDLATDDDDTAGDDDVDDDTAGDDDTTEPDVNTTTGCTCGDPGLPSATALTAVAFLSMGLGWRRRM